MNDERLIESIQKDVELIMAALGKLDDAINRADDVACKQIGEGFYEYHELACDVNEALGNVVTHVMAMSGTLQDLDHQTDDPNVNALRAWKAMTGK